MEKRLTSVLTDDMDHCMFTGSNRVERHHVFGGCYKKKSEARGFIAPLRPDLHVNGVFAGPQAKDVDNRLKRMCQEYYEEHYGTRKEFIEEFGKSRL